MKKIYLLLVLLAHAYNLQAMKKTALDVVTTSRDTQKIILDYLDGWNFDYLEEIKFVPLSRLQNTEQKYYTSSDGQYRVLATKVESSDMHIEVYLSQGGRGQTQKMAQFDRPVICNILPRASSKDVRLAHLLLSSKKLSKVYSVIHSSDETHTAFVHGDHLRTIELLDRNSGRINTVRLNEDVEALAFSPDNKYLAVGFGRKVRLYDTSTGEVTIKINDDNDLLPDSEDRVQSLAFSADGTHLIILGYVRIDNRDKMVIIFKQQRKELEQAIIDEHEGQASSEKQSSSSSSGVTSVAHAQTVSAPEGLHMPLAIEGNKMDRIRVNGKKCIQKCTIL